MTSIAQKRRYMQHEITTKEKSVKAYRETKDIDYGVLENVLLLLVIHYLYSRI